MANASKADPSHMAITGDFWEFIGVLGGSFFLSVYPSKGPTPTWHKVLRVVGVVMVNAMYALFRRPAATARYTGSPEATRISLV